MADLITIVRDADDGPLPDVARNALLVLAKQIEDLDQRIDKVETAMVRRSQADETAGRLASIPGIGAIAATALQALVPDPGGFTSGRHTATWWHATSMALRRGWAR